MAYGREQISALKNTVTNRRSSQTAKNLFWLTR